jgi:hypothetical protein
LVLNAVVQWEYQVIRLNVEPPVATAPAAQAPPAAAPPAAEAGGAPAAQAQPSSGSPGKRAAGFSEAYLREEFPRYYDNPPAQQGQGQPEDPGAQLQAFFNGHGQQGWELVGFQHAAPHVFIVFKRPAGSGDAAAQAEQLRLTLDLANRALAIIEKQAG